MIRRALHFAFTRLLGAAAIGLILVAITLPLWVLG
jgi:hypothetical protein